MMNQCDGCRAGVPTEIRETKVGNTTLTSKLHLMSTRGGYRDYMICEADRYKEDKQENA